MPEHVEDSLVMIEEDGRLNCDPGAELPEVLEVAEGDTPFATQDMLSSDPLSVVEIAESDSTLSARVSALLFVATRPLPVQTLADAAKGDLQEVEQVLISLKEQFQNKDIGFNLVEIGGAWQFRTCPQLARNIHSLIPPRAKRLSRAAAETLAVIAYQQPVQRAEIEAVRGVDALPTLKTLLEARLIRIVGRADTAGHPALYGTTEQFLQKFGLRDLSELPTVRELKEFSQEPDEDNEGIDSSDVGGESIVNESSEHVVAGPL